MSKGPRLVLGLNGILFFFCKLKHLKVKTKKADQFKFTCSFYLLIHINLDVQPILLLLFWLLFTKVNATRNRFKILFQSLSSQFRERKQNNCNLDFICLGFLKYSFLFLCYSLYRWSIIYSNDDSNIFAFYSLHFSTFLQTLWIGLFIFCIKLLIFDYFSNQLTSD